MPDIARELHRREHINSIGMVELLLHQPSRFEAVAASGAATVRQQIELNAPGFLDDLPTSMATMAVATLLAHALKPYGTGSRADLSSMLAAATLDCSNYGLFTLHISRILAPDIDIGVEIHFVGWQSDAIGNHQMLFAATREAGQGPLVLDPCVGVIAKGTLDWVASQRPLSPSNILAFHQQPILDASRDQVVDALIQGRLKPSELLYCFESEEHLINRFGVAMDWPTPGAVAWRRKYLPR